MTITLEQIQGMNLQLGEIIEMTIKPIFDEERFKELGYFQGYEDDWMIRYSSCKNSNPVPNNFINTTHIKQIEKVRRLKYAD